MKYLDHDEHKNTQASVTQNDIDNKMLSGSRPDQRRPLRPTPRNVLKLADELNVDLAHVEPTGEDGMRITEDDVRKAAENPKNRLPGDAQLSGARRENRERTGQSNNAPKGQNAPNSQPNGTPSNPSNPAKAPGAMGPTGTSNS